MVQWLTAVLNLILKEMSVSCHLKFPNQTSFSRTKDQLLMLYARNTRTTECHFWDSKKNGNFVLFKYLVERSPRHSECVRTFEEAVSMQSIICMYKTAA